MATTAGRPTLPAPRGASCTTSALAPSNGRVLEIPGRACPTTRRTTKAVIATTLTRAASSGVASLLGVHGPETQIGPTGPTSTLRTTCTLALTTPVRALLRPILATPSRVPEEVSLVGRTGPEAFSVVLQTPCPRETPTALAMAKACKGATTDQRSSKGVRLSEIDSDIRFQPTNGTLPTRRLKKNIFITRPTRGSRFFQGLG